jgi:hypothetical protein
MTSSTHDERWEKLCEAIAEEPDSNRLLELVAKLNHILEEREKRFRRSMNSGENGSVNKHAGDEDL